MLRFGAGDSSRRVPFRHTAFRKVSLRGRRGPPLPRLLRHGHARLAWSLTSFVSALVPAWMPCTTPAGRLRLDWFGGGRCAAAFQPAGWFLLVVPASLLASPDGLGTFVGCSTHVLSQPHTRLTGLRCGSRSLSWPFRPSSFTLPHPPASVIPRSSRIAEIPIEVSCRTFYLKQQRF